MTERWNGQVAVLADPHLHDTSSGQAYGLPTNDCFRSFAESAASTRIFNEGGPALVRALDLLVERGIRIVMVAGDLTDDGQAPNWQASAKLLQNYSRRHGMRFFLTPGNHDQWFGDGVALRKQMVHGDGSTFIVSGDPTDATAQYAPAMRRIGHAEMLTHASGFGYCRHPDDLHWETPFGTSDALSDRIGSLSRSGMDLVEVPDLSYLVEPVSGLWILSLDASVYLPDGDSWRDFGQEGWIAVLRYKRWLLDWMQDVSHRARKSGKRLLTMSHYPAIDVLNEVPGGLSKRVMPTRVVSDEVTATGLGLHFSGHWHINRTGGSGDATGWLVNVAVPSTASFPAGFKLVEFADDAVQIETVRLGEVPDFDKAFAHYQAEQPEAALVHARNYDHYLALHLRGLTEHRYLGRDWPSEFAASINNKTLAEILTRTGVHATDEATAITARVAIEDYYALERGGQLSGIPLDRLAVYRSLDQSIATVGDESTRRLILGLARYSQALPDDRFTVDLTNGKVT